MRNDKHNLMAGVKGPGWIGIVESALLVWVLAVAVLRATFIETPHVEGMWRTSALSNEATSLLLSVSALAALAVWVIVGAIAGRLRRRRTYFAGAVGVFCAVALAGAWFASDKRAALTDLVTLASGPAAGLLAVQLFDRREKVRLFLWLLLAVGAAATYACYDKMTSTGGMLIAEYEKNPEAFLETLGIETGSLEHWQYEHRLYGQDVSGFLTTSNSTGSFFLLAVFAGAGLCLEAFAARRGSEPTLVALLCTALATGLVLAGLLMTQSKGAIGSLIIFTSILCIVVVFRQTLWVHRRSLCVGLVVLAVGAVAAMTAYGLRHGRLPGGNSMLVRWQYWHSSAQMASDSPLLGIGGGNYATHYLKYKEPAAPETIGDPHNWVFSLLCQFGIIGLAAMGLAMIRPASRLLGAVLRQPEKTELYNGPPYGERYVWLGIAAGVTAAMILIRPSLLQLGGPDPGSLEQAAAYLLMVVIPAGIVAGVFGLLRFTGAGDVSLGVPNRRLAAALACGMGAVLLHNLVDFALFEPGVWMMFWLTAAAGVALIDNQTTEGGYRLIPLATLRQRAVMALVPAGVMAAIVLCAVVPPLRRGALIHEAIHTPNVVAAQSLIEQAAAADRLSPSAAATGARLMLQRFKQQPASGDRTLPDTARVFAETAIERSPADPRPRRLLGDILLAKAELSDPGAEKLSLQEQAYTTFQEAVARYPGADALHYRLGVLAEEVGQDDAAIAHLETALAIETAYRAQFRVMYPDQDEVVSRLGPKAYEDVTQRLERLKHSLF